MRLVRAAEPDPIHIVDPPDLAQILSRSENQVCCDCSAPKPKWASVNPGVFICLDCAGGHRCLGVHISKVKSVSLDKWSEADLQMCDAVGNRIANEYYEAKLKILPRSSAGFNDQTRKEFIHRKYTKLEWAPKDEEQPGKLPPLVLMLSMSTSDDYETIMLTARSLSGEEVLTLHIEDFNATWNELAISRKLKECTGVARICMVLPDGTLLSKEDAASRKIFELFALDAMILGIGC
jgi:hypothetical protein